MILHSTSVDQAIDSGVTANFIKEIIVARRRSPRVGADDIPLAMVRKRAAVADEALDTRAAVLLVHGYGQNRYAWHLPSRSFGNYLAAAGFDVFNLDLRGHGRSRHLGAHLPGALSDYVEEDLPVAIDEVLRQSGHERIFLIGHSLGGLISYCAAASRPAPIAGVISLGSPYHFTRDSRTLRWLGSLMLRIDRHVRLDDQALPLEHVGELFRLARGWMESALFPLPLRAYAPRSMEARVLGQHMALAMDRGSIAVMRDMFRQAAESRASGHRLGALYGYAARFENLDLPLLVIAGAADDFAPPSAVRPAYELSRSSDKHFQVFPRGHIDLIMGREAPATVWPRVRDWMALRAATSNTTEVST